MTRWVLVLCWLLGSIGAAQAAFFTDDEAHKKIAELQQQLNQLQSQVQGKLDEQLKQRQALDGRVSTLESQLKSQGMIDLLNQIERINGEVSKLKGQIEVMSHDVEITQKRQRDLYTDLDGRLRKLETGAPAAKPATDAAAPAAAATPSAATPQPPVVADNAENEQKDYEAAYSLTKTGKHAEAVTAFQQFIEHYPNGKLTPNAYYWMGTAQFSQRDYKSAIATQQKLVKQYPDHEKAPDALLNIANSQIQLAEVDAARQTLKSVIAKYPLSTAAPLAKKRLAAIESLKTKT
jgi:tol-pal system protein YbgF